MCYNNDIKRKEVNDMEHDVTFDNIADYFISTSNATGSLITNL